MKTVTEDYTKFWQTKGLKDIVEVGGASGVQLAISKGGEVYTWGTPYSPIHGRATNNWVLPTKINGLQLGMVLVGDSMAQQ